MAKEIADKKTKREAAAHFYAVAATVSSCVILDEDGTEVFTGTGGFDAKPGDVSSRALAVLATILQDAELLVSENPQLHDVQARLFGLRIRDRLRIMALDALRHGVTENASAPIPVGLWYHRPFEPAPFCDPYEAAIPSDLRADVPYDGLCDFLGIKVPSNVAVDTDAHLQADLARQIALKCQLFYNG